MTSRHITYIILTIIATTAVIIFNPAQAVTYHPIFVNVIPSSGAASLTVNLSVNLGGSSSKTIDWNFGDGTSHDTTNKATLGHTYQNSGNFTGSVDVTF